MTEKRFVIKPSAIVTDGFVIIDKEKKYTFPILDSTLNYMFCKALNELREENEQLKFENNELKCALALDGVDYIIADGKKIDIPPYYEFEQRYDSVMHRREYDGYD